jgi:hypothetical protein
MTKRSESIKRVWEPMELARIGSLPALTRGLTGSGNEGVAMTMQVTP